MKCPICKLENPDIARRCDCGYDFFTKSLEKSYLTDNGESNGTSRKPHNALVVLGWISSLLGGWLGIIIACLIAYGKDQNNRLEYRFDEDSRKNGKNMLLVSVCMLGVWIILQILLIISNE